MQSAHIPLTPSRRGATISVFSDEAAPTFWQRYQAGKYVVDPHQNKLLPLWDALMLLLIVVISFRVPYQLGFCWILELTHSPLRLNAFIVVCVDYAIDALFCIDIFLQLFISMPDPENWRWSRSPRIIIKKYVRSFLLTDVVSVIPYGHLSKIARERFGGSFKYLGILKLLSLVKIQRIDRLRIRYDSRMGFPNAMTKLAKLVMLLILSLHWIACTWGGILTLQKMFDMNIGYTWSDALRAAKPALFKSSHYEHPWELYTASLYWSCYTLTSIGYGDITANNMVEAWAAILLMGSCGVIWANIIGSICAITGALDADNVAHENQMDAINDMLNCYDISQHMRMQVREYFQRRKVLNNRSRYSELIDCMSPSMQGLVARKMQATLVEKVWIFRGAMSDSFVVGLFRCFEFAIYPPRELAKLHGCFVCLRTGVALQLANILQPGAFWGISDLIVHNRRLWEKKEVLALSYLEVQYLERDCFGELLETFPDECQRIRKGACWLALKEAAKLGYIADLLESFPQIRRRSYEHMAMDSKLSLAMQLLTDPKAEAIASKVAAKVDDLLIHFA